MVSEGGSDEINPNSAYQSGSPSSVQITRMVSEGGGDEINPNSESHLNLKSEAVDGPIEPGLRASDGTPQAAENPSLVDLSVKISDSTKPREAFNREMYRIPSYAGWFSWGKIHTIERRALSEFFDGSSLSKTPKVYKEYREFIINKYRDNSHRALTFTEVRKMLVGDVNLLRKVFDFLEYWGLINYHVASENKMQPEAVATLSPSNYNPSASDIKQQETVAESSVTTTSLETNAIKGSEAIPPGVRVVYPGSTPGSSQTGKPAAPSLNRPPGISPPMGLSSHMDKFARPGIAVVTEAVGESQSLTNSSGDWTMQEVLRLLEAIAKFGADWNRVAAHVGTKSKAECVLHFIRLPFGDQFTSDVGATPPNLSINTEPIGNSSKKGKDEEQKDGHGGTVLVDGNSFMETLGSDEVIDEPPSKRSRISPLADSSNPILAQVAFLSSMVGSRVAAAAAEAAVAALAEEDPSSSQILNTSNQNAYKDVPTSKDVINEDDTNPLVGKGEAFKDLEGVTELPKEPGCSVTYVRAGIGAVLGAVSVNAKLLADQEEREIEQIMASIIENQFRKLQSKVDHYEELEFLLEREHSQLEKARLQVLADWIRYSQYHYNSGPG